MKPLTLLSGVIMAVECIVHIVGMLTHDVSNIPLASGSHIMLTGITLLALALK